MSPTPRRVQVRRYDLPFIAPVRTAAGTFTHRTGWLVGLEGTDGRMGWGDAAPWPGFGVDYAGTCASLASAEGQFADERGFLERVGSRVVAEAALSQAACDLRAQAEGVALRALGCGSTRGGERGPGAVDFIEVHALVNTAEGALAAVARGYRTLKVKVGFAEIAMDLRRLRAIREAVGAGIALRLDANGAFGGDDAVAASLAFSEVGPSLIEQPGRTVADCIRVRRETRVRVALDESLSSPAAVQDALEREAMDVAVIKPAFFPSWTGALLAAQQCRRAGIGVIVTCALESAIGRWGALHLAAALGAEGEPAGLEAPLAEDVAGFPAAVDGWLRPEWRPGLGVAPC